MPFIGGLVGYVYAPEKIIEVSVVQSKTITSSLDVYKQDVDKVILELIGASRKLDDVFQPISIDTAQTKEQYSTIMLQLENNRYNTSLPIVTPQQFILQVDTLSQAEKYQDLASLIPVQGFFYSIEGASYHVSGRSVISGGEVWLPEQTRTLLPIKRFNEIVKDTDKAIRNPVRFFRIHYDKDVALFEGKTALDYVTCEKVDDQIEVEDILAIGLENPIAGGGPSLREVHLADMFFKCYSGWGGGGSSLYIQPNSEGTNYEIIGEVASFWE